MKAWSFLRDALRGRILAKIGALWLLTVVVLGIAAPLVAPFDPLEIDPIARLSEPGAPYLFGTCLLYTSPSPRDGLLSRMPSSA